MSQTYSLSAWQELLRSWTGWADVYLPVQTSQGWSWRLNAVDTVHWLQPDYRPTDYPVKRWLLPSRERLFSYSLANGAAEVDQNMHWRPQVYVGVLPCDLAALALLDRVYQAGGGDPWYQARRDQLYLVGLTCNGSRDAACCCDQLPQPSGNAADLMVMLDSGILSVEVVNPAGQELLDLIDSEAVSIGWYGPPPVASGPLAVVDIPTEHWAKQAETCLACGACSFVCPTCLCYDMDDQIQADGESGERWRTTDSCQLSGFALVAGGHNFRPTVASRLEHRFRQKLEYLPKRYGQAFCVGCGRCQRHCLAGHSMGDTLRQLVKADG